MNLKFWQNGHKESETIIYSELQLICLDFPHMFTRPLKDDQIFWYPEKLWAYMRNRITDLRNRLTKSETEFETRKHTALSVLYHVGRKSTENGRESVTFADMESLVEMAERFYTTIENIHDLEDIIARLESEGIE